MKALITNFLPIATILALTSCSINITPKSTPTPSPKSVGSSMHAGGAYIDSCKAALHSTYCCEWPDSYPGSDEPGAAYEEARAAVEDSDCHG